MLKVVEAFSGIGAQAKALERIKHKYGYDYEIMNTSEWDIFAIVAYDLIHNGKQDLSEVNEMSVEEIASRLKKYTLSSNGKEPLKNLNSLNTNVRKRVLAAIARTKNLVSITDIHSSDLPSDIDVLTYSFPCQNLSIASVIHGHMTGIDKSVSNRSGMLWEIERILDERKKHRPSKMPRFLLMENVTTLVSPKFRSHFEEWKQHLSALGYINCVYKLCADQFGIPQTRTRLFMISVYLGEDLEKFLPTISQYFEEHNLQTNTSYVDSLKLDSKNISQILRFDYSNRVYSEEADASRLPNTPSRYGIVEKNPHIYDLDSQTQQMHCRACVNTITTRQDRNPTTGVIRYGVKNNSYLDYRYLTPRECFLAMGFDEDDFNILLSENFNLAKNKLFFTPQKLEKMAGNSIVVNVLEAIFIQINEIQEILMSD